MFPFNTVCPPFQVTVRTSFAVLPHTSEEYYYNHSTPKFGSSVLLRRVGVGLNILCEIQQNKSEMP
jgi:hypothetical protein